MKWLILGLAGVALIGAIRNRLTKLAAVPLSSPQIPHAMSRLAFHFKRLHVEIFTAC
jgi:hypothetical protein